MPDIHLPNGLIRTAQQQELDLDQRHTAEAEELVRSLVEVREEIEQKLTQLLELSQRLRTHVLRRRTDLTGAYLACSNAHLRICGALSQGVRRTAGIVRTLDTSKLALEDQQRRERELAEKAKIRASQRHVEKLSLPESDDFDQVFGDDFGETN